MVEALATGVPITAMPNLADQPINAAVIEKLNAGRWLKDKSPEGVRKLVEEMLSNEEIKVSNQKCKELFDSLSL
jgi:UDP:flavonoid glycosyltransferase YjiC (YdhE family)